MTQLETSNREYMTSSGANKRVHSAGSVHESGDDGNVLLIV